MVIDDIGSWRKISTPIHMCMVQLFCRQTELAMISEQSLVRVSACHLLLIFSAHCMLVYADLHEVCFGPNGEQPCEDYTYAGSLVEDLPFAAAFQDVLLLKEQFDGFPFPLGPDLCTDDLATWMNHVEDYFRSGTFHAELLIPMQNHIMSHHEEVAEHCPVAWLLTLLLKIESNLENGRQGRSCARVHAIGCLRDARGYWKIYGSLRAQYGSYTEVPPESQPPANSLLLEAEVRVLTSFRQSLST